MSLLLAYKLAGLVIVVIGLLIFSLAPAALTAWLYTLIVGGFLLALGSLG